MIKSPETAFPDYVDEINMLKGKPLAEIEFPLKKIEYAVLRAKESFPADVFAILGMIECLRGNEKKMDAFHDRAIKLSMGSDEDFKLRYATSLNLVGRHLEAYKLAKEVYEGNPLNTDAISPILVAAHDLGYGDEYEYFYRKAKDLYLGEFPVHTPSFIKEFLSEKGLNDAVQSYQEIIAKTFTDIDYHNVTLDADPETDDQWVSVNLYLKSSPERAFEEYEAYLDEVVPLLPSDEGEYLRLSLNFV